METQIKGLSNIQMPVIRNMLPVQLSKYSIHLGFCETFHDALDESDFLLIDGEKFLSESHDSLFVEELIQNGKPVYAILMNKDYRQKLQILNKEVLDCFDYPIMSDILSKTIRNQLMRYVGGSSYSPQVLNDSSTEYHVHSDNSQRKVHLEFIPSKSNQWFMRYRSSAVSVSRFEKRIVEYLLTTRKMATKKELAYVGWENFEIKDNTVVVTIKKIRDLFHKLRVPVKIRNLYGFGYSVDILR